ncbi:MAG: PocR ligand-binding domain-containing protein [Spirochaetales bacterium]|nr:PocR ligand-binding domain-containing protein [Spirochaetales bacterium]
MDNEIIFNRAIKASEDYQNATGIKCIVISASGERVENQKKIPVCTYCSIENEGNKISKCSDTHLYGLYQTERFGGKYIYFCSLSLMHWVSPILSEGVLIGGLFCGPVLAYDHEDYMMEEVLKDSVFTDTGKTNFKKYIHSIPYINPSRVNSLSELLLITASYLSSEKTVLQEQISSIKQQSDINSYIQYIKSMECEPEHKQKYPIEKERELLMQISRADIQGARRTLNEILGSVFFSSGNKFEIIKSRVLELVVLLSRAALEGGADVEQIFGLNYRLLNNIHNYTTVEELSYWLSTIMKRFADLVFSLKSIKHTDVIYKSIHYMNNHFNEKIILDDVADEVSLSPAYFSKIFKEQTNDNFTHYLNKLRIGKSKSLLRDSTIPLVDIAGMVGYEDQSYFSKVFKKITGSTPGKYRDTRGLIETNNQEIHE